MDTVCISSYTHWLCFHYEPYIGINQYRCTTCIHVVYMLYSKRMLLTERQRFTTLWSSVMSVDCTLLCAVKSFGLLCEKNHSRAVLENTAQAIRCSPKGPHLIPWTSAVFPNTALKCISLFACLLCCCSYTMGITFFSNQDCQNNPTKPQIYSILPFSTAPLGLIGFGEPQSSVNLRA